MKAFLILALCINLCFSKPVSRFDINVETHCKFFFGNTELLTQACIQAAKEATLGMYLNLVRTRAFADGNTRREILDRPSTHGNIYDENTPTAPSVSY